MSKLIPIKEQAIDIDVDFPIPSFVEHIVITGIKIFLI